MTITYSIPCYLLRLIGLFIFTISTFQNQTFAQSYPYEEAWEKIEEQEKEGLLKSTLPLVEEIYNQAQKEGQAQNKIKALLYQSKILLIGEEDIHQEEKLFTRFQSEINRAEPIEKSLLQSLLAELLQEYFQSNRYKIVNRTELTGPVTDNFLTWSTSTFQKEIVSLLDASVSQADFLSREPIENWIAVLDTAAQSRELQPTMYDLLAHRAIDLYNRTNQEEKSKELIRKLLDLHKDSSDKNAYLYIRMLSLNQAKQSAIVQIVELKDLSALYPEAWYTSEVLLKLAETYLSNSNSAPLDSKKLYLDSIFALETLMESSYSTSRANAQLKTITTRILSPDLSIQMEKFNIPGQAIPAFVTHKNINKLYIKILAFKSPHSNHMEGDFNAYPKTQADLDSLLDLYPVVQSLAVDLKDFDDYQIHSTIIKIDKLNNGEYLTLLSCDSSFTIENNPTFSVNSFKVSKNAIVSRRRELLLTDRETGKPIKNTKVSIYSTSKTSKALTLKESLITDTYGMVRLENSASGLDMGSGLYFCQVDGDDTYTSIQLHLPSTNNENERASFLFFIDRGIYRPGQTVYFKGISYKEKGENKQISANSKVTVDLYDPNGGKIESQELTTNSYGSVFGSFVLPAGKITGKFHFRTSDNNVLRDFQVEEYKRPTFEVVLDTIKDTFKIGHEVISSGKVQAFSGDNLDQAKIKYRVTRENYFPYLLWNTTIFRPRSSIEEIAAGETTTNNEGRFEVKFMAKPYEDSIKDGFRFYNYMVQITAIDVNGESHESSQKIVVGDKSVLLNIPVAQKINIDYLTSIPLKTENLNRQKVSAQGNVRLTKLKSPSRVLVNSLSNQVDYSLEDSLTFIKNFPHHPYLNEQNSNNWAKGEVVLNEDFDSTVQDSIKLNPSKAWQEGAYLLEAYVLDGSDTLRISKLVQLYRSKSKKPIDQELLRVSLTQPSYKPGDHAEILFSSAAGNATVLVEFEQGGKIVNRRQVTLNKEVKTVKFPLGLDADEQVFVHYYMAKYNTQKRGIVRIPIIQPSSELKITTNTFRDKLQPGQEEVWELKISGGNKDKLSSEVLALMYDASLDQFVKNSFSLPATRMFNNSSIPRWNAYYSYDHTYARRAFYPVYGNTKPLKLENLAHFGFGFAHPLTKQNNYLHQIQMQLASSIFESVSETVNVGYGRALQDVPVANVEQLLQGKISGVQGFGYTVAIRGVPNNQSPPIIIVDGVVVESGLSLLNQNDIHSIEVVNDPAITSLYDADGRGVVIVTTKAAFAQAEMLSAVPIRKNLQETAFFYPDLKTDEEGNVKIRFTTPEKLTEWKFMVLAHTEDLQTAFLQRKARTSKDLMVVPNAPRFLRTGDELTLSTKIINLSDTALTGSAKLMFFDALTMEPLDRLFASTMGTKEFDMEKASSTTVSWQFKVPDVQQNIIYRIAASAGDFTDGEESILPILPNRIQVTEAVSLYAKKGQKKQFTLPSLANSASSNPEHLRLTLEIASNPVWYAIQALPYLNESSHQNSEQVFAQLYSSLVSKHLVDASPKIKTIFDNLNKNNELKSQLQNNEELTNLLIEETPWVRAAENEENRMKRLALLFDVNTLRQTHESTFQRLAIMQMGSGAFPWFEGGSASPLITTHILAGFGHLKALNINNPESTSSNYKQVLDKAVQYLDERTKEYLDEKTQKTSVPTYSLLHYLYARSYFLKEYPIGDTIVSDIFKAFEGGSFTHTTQSKAMLALVYNRFGEQKKASALVKSLKDYAVQSDELGMYWKDNKSGWAWWQSPIETQALLIEAFQEITNDTESVAQMKVWLLKNKQTTHWASTKATTEAVYSLLLTGGDWLAVEGGLEVKIGDKTLSLDSEASGAGYYKTSWNKSEIKADMAAIEINKTSPGIVWGGLYWQYFQSLDQIKPSANGVRVEKALFLKKNTDKGVVLTPIAKDNPIKVGDVVMVRLVIQADRAMQFMHLKDMRASGFEPVHVLSTYKWQDGLGYYESTRDAATHFFIDQMPKGTYVFEYDVRANNIGSFSNGITTLQNMYAPDMSAHSEEIHVDIL